MPSELTTTNQVLDAKVKTTPIYLAPLRALFVLGAVLFLVEFGVMHVLPFLPLTETWLHDLTDATLMVLLSFPALHYAVLRPLQRHIAERQRMEAELRGHREQLERTVQQRTAELTQRNQQLESEVEERKRMQAELAWQASFPELDPAPVLEVDLSGRVHYVNPVAQRLLPDLAENRLHHPWLADWASVVTRLQQAGTDPVGREVTVGDSCFYQTLHQVAEARRIRIYGLDITEQKGMERALRQSEEFNRSIIESSHDCIKVLDLQGRLQYMNNGGQQLLGITELSSYLGMTYEEFWKGTDRESVHAAITAARQGKTGKFTGYCPTVRGTPKWWDVIISPIFGLEGRVARLLVASRDITARKEAEEALLKINELLEQRVAERTAELQTASLYARSVIEASLDPFVTIGADGKITDVNRASEEVTGVPRERMVGSCHLDYVTDPEAASVGFQKALSQGLVRNYPLTIRHVSGRTTEVLYNGTAYRDPAGRILGMFATAHDVTERKQLQRQILEAGETERRRIGQDLHDSLGGRLAGTALLSKALAQTLSAKHLPEAALAEEVVQCVNEAIAETRSIARGLSPVEVGEFGLTSGLREFAAETQHRFGVQCRFETSGDLSVPNTAGATNLFRITQEAVTNSIRHGKAREIAITLTQTGQHLLLQIRDNGSGILPTESPSTGMGLRTMTYRAELIGGHLEVKPAEGGGTLVSCSVPLASLAAPKP